jgi:hypothetical protein
MEKSELEKMFEEGFRKAKVAFQSRALTYEKLMDAIEMLEGYDEDSKSRAKREFLQLTPEQDHLLNSTNSIFSRKSGICGRGSIEFAVYADDTGRDFPNYEQVTVFTGRPYARNSLPLFTIDSRAVDHEGMGIDSGRLMYEFNQEHDPDLARKVKEAEKLEGKTYDPRLVYETVMNILVGK